MLWFPLSVRLYRRFASEGLVLSVVMMCSGVTALAQVEPLPPVQPSPTWPAEPIYSAASPLDAGADAAAVMGGPADPPSAEYWTSQVLPSGLIWHSYMAGTREPCFRSVWGTLDNGQKVWDVTLGGRVGIWRYGNTNCNRPEGWQLDMEGAAMPRLDPVGESTDLIAVDYRYGIQQTYGYGPFQAKFGYYHLSSHLGDEFMLANPAVVRINFVRDSGIIGISYYLTDDLRLYGETAYAFGAEDGAEPLEFQFGVEYSPIRRDGGRWSPFAAVNGHLRQELNYGGDLVVQVGWQLRNGAAPRRFRLGAQYYNGYNEQGEFFAQREQKAGFGLWYDY